MLNTCPVRELDPEADFFIDWMLATHRLGQNGWVLHRLPGAGPVGGQDARLMDGMGCARSEANALLAEQRDQKDADVDHE